jgi:hypothetical protein
VGATCVSRNGDPLYRTRSFALPEEKMIAAEQKRLIEGFLDAYNSFDVDGMVKLLHPDCMFQNISGQEITASARGLAEFRELAEKSKALFSSRCQKVLYFESAGAKATVGIAFEGRLRADLPNRLKAGDALKLEGKSVYEFQDGLICGLTDYS